MPANVLMGRGSPLFMYLLSPASLSSPNLSLDLMVFWTRYPGSRHGAIWMLQHKDVQKTDINLDHKDNRSRFSESLFKGQITKYIKRCS